MSKPPKDTTTVRAPVTTPKPGSDDYEGWLGLVAAVRSTSGK